MQIAKLQTRYLLVINIPLYAWEGGYFSDQLWAHDLRRHLEYIEHLTLFCPVCDERPPATMVRLDLANEFRGLRIEGVRPSHTTLSALLRSWSDFRRVYRAAAACEIVHASAIGWPIPLGYYAFLAARMLPRFFIDVMESSPWRSVPGVRTSIAKRLRGCVMEAAARWIARHSQLSLFTSEAYRSSMVEKGQAYAHLFKAVWVTREQILRLAELDARLQARRGRRLVVGFAARLVPEKGVRILLEALRGIEPGVSLEVRVVGTGELEQEMRRFVPPAGSDVALEFCGLVEYGAPFYAELDRWNVAVVPSLSVEQPRIVYDAFARGVPVFASDTPALAECVRHGFDGFLFPAGNPDALMRLLTAAAQDRAKLERCARNAIATAAAHSHERMHENRAALIHEAWQKWSDQRPAAARIAG